ncbi:MAG: DUF935 family protein [Planctomycetota bacterium]
MSGLLSRVSNAVGVLRGKGAAPKGGRLVLPMPAAESDLFTGELTPELAVSILRTAAYGDPSQQDSLFNTMLERDGHLDSVYNQRLRALTGKDWELVPASQVGKSPRIEEGLAEDAHAYCLEVLGDLDGWEAVLCHLAEAIGRTTSAAELLWESVDGSRRPVAAVPISFALLTADSRDPGRLRFVVEGDWEGIAADAYPAGKFLIHTPRSLGGNRFRGGLLRGAVLGYMFKNFGRKWWLFGLEKFGLPIVIGKCEDEDKATKDALVQLIRDMGVNRGGFFPIGAEVEIKEAAVSKGEWPHERIIKHINLEYSKEFVGQTLTTEIGETGGARAAAEVHDDVRGDLTEDDARKEGSTIREQLLVPLVRYRFGDGAVIGAPYFRRVTEEEKDLEATARLISTAVNELGAQVPKSIVEDELGIPLLAADNRDEPLPGRRTGFDPFGFEPAANRADKPASQLCSCGHDTVVIANRHLTEIVARRRTAVAKAVGWIVAAVLASQAHTRNVIAQVGSHVEQAGSLERSLDTLPDLFDRLPVEDLVDLENHFLVAGQLAGRLHVIQRASVNSRRFPGRGFELVANAERIDFERIPFVEAIEALRDRVGLRPDAFEALDAQARSRAWRVAGVWNMDLLAVVHRALVSSMAAGETSRDFRLRLPVMFDRLGWTGENPWHADIVHYQNFAMAHAAGRLGQYREFEINAWRFVNTGESCPICEPVVGKVFALDDRRFFPPLHFWCDCEDEPVFDEELDEGEIQDSTRVENPALAQEQSRLSGFKWDPAEYGNLEALRLSRFPEALRGVFGRFGSARGWEVVG